MLKHAVLGLLTERRSYGYELVQRLDDRLGPAWQLNPSAVYGALDQLEDQGYICVAERPGGETRRRAARVVYEVTEDGLLLFRRWIGSLSSRAEPIRSELQLKLALATPADRAALLAAITQEEARLRRVRDRCTPRAERGEDWQATLGGLIAARAVARADAELEWLAAVRAKLERFAAAPELSTSC